MLGQNSFDIGTRSKVGVRVGCPFTCSEDVSSRASASQKRVLEDHDSEVVFVNVPGNEYGRAVRS